MSPFAESVTLLDLECFSGIRVTDMGSTPLASSILIFNRLYASDPTNGNQYRNKSAGIRPNLSNRQSLKIRARYRAERRKHMRARRSAVTIVIFIDVAELADAVDSKS